MLMRPTLAARIAAMVVAAFVAGSPLIAAAEDTFPDRTIRIIVPLPPGAAADTLPRILAEKLQLQWGQPVIVENRAGAANNLGAEMVARANPDGYTLLATPPGPLVIAQSLYSKLGFDPSAFVPVSVIATLPNTLVASPNLPVANLSELVKYAKDNPGKITYASAGIGSTPHLAAEELQIAAGIRLVHVPYKGLAPALTDLIGGHVDTMFDNIGNTLSQIKQGTIKGIAIGSKERLPDLPDLPTVAETFPGFYSATWFAIVAPPKTPAQVAAKLSQAIAAILKMPDVDAKFRELACIPVGGTPQDTASFLQQERERWRNVIAIAGIKQE